MSCIKNGPLIVVARPRVISDALMIFNVPSVNCAETGFRWLNPFPKDFLGFLEHFIRNGLNTSPSCGVFGSPSVCAISCSATDLKLSALLSIESSIASSLAARSACNGHDGNVTKGIAPVGGGMPKDENSKLVNVCQAFGRRCQAPNPAASGRWLV